MASYSAASTTQSHVVMPEELRLVLLGRTGSGKSATGNTILGRNCFESELSMTSVTRQCQKESGVVQGRNLALIDTPGWFDTSVEQSKTSDEVLRCLAMCSPGPHAFLLIIPIARFTDEQQQTIDGIEEVFENISDHTIIIFTCADKLKGESIEQFIQRQDKIIHDLVARFGRRFLAFNNTNPENQDQVNQLVAKLDELLQQNMYRHFTNQRTQVVETAVSGLGQIFPELAQNLNVKAIPAVKQMAEYQEADTIKAQEKEKKQGETSNNYFFVNILTINNNKVKLNQLFNNDIIFTVLKYLIIVLTGVIAYKLFPLPSRHLLLRLIVQFGGLPAHVIGALKKLLSSP